MAINTVISDKEQLATLNKIVFSVDSSICASTVGGLTGISGCMKALSLMPPQPRIYIQCSVNTVYEYS